MVGGSEVSRVGGGGVRLAGVGAGGVGWGGVGWVEEVGDLTWEEAVVKFPPLRRNIASSQRDNLDHFNVIPDNTSSVWEEPWTAGTVLPSASSIQ